MVALVRNCCPHLQPRRNSTSNVCLTPRARHPAASAQMASEAFQSWRAALVPTKQHQAPASRTQELRQMLLKPGCTNCCTKPSLLRIQPRRSLMSLTTASKSIRSSAVRFAELAPFHSSVHGESMEAPNCFDFRPCSLIQYRVKLSQHPESSVRLSSLLMVWVHLNQAAVMI